MTRTLGPIVTTYTVEQAVLSTLQYWLPYYLSETERDSGITAGFTQRPLGWATSYDLDNFLQVQTPSILIFSPGTTGTIEKMDGQLHGAWFAFQAGALVDDQSEPLARKVAATYQGAMAAVLAQNGGLTGLATSTNLTSYEQRLPDPSNRTQALGIVHFEVFVEGILDGNAGPGKGEVPPNPDTGPWPSLPLVFSETISFGPNAVTKVTPPATGVSGIDDVDVVK